MKTYEILVVTLVWLICSEQSNALIPSQIDRLETELGDSANERSASATAGYAQLIGFISDAAVSGYVLDIENSLGSEINIFH